MVIGLQNPGLFTEMKRRKVAKAAAAFFGSEMEIQYQNSVEGLDNSLIVKFEQEREKKLEEKKKAASQSDNVKRILKLFPKSKIISVEPLEEQEDV